MDPLDRWLFVVGTGIHMVLFCAAGVVTIVFVLYQLFFGKVVIAIITIVIFEVVRPWIEPDKDRIEAMGYFLEQMQREREEKAQREQDNKK